MPRRLPRTLWRCYTLEVLRLLGVTAGVLVTVIAFAGAIKPLSDGVLQAGEALTFILLAIPPMLAYALPFAGGFAATLVYHRISTDLEAVAAYAGGVSHRVLLAPALAMALLCAGSLVALNEQVIPRFLHRMQEMITVNVAKLISGQVARGQSVSFRNMMIYADSVRAVKPDPGSDVLEQLLMTRFGMIMLKDGEPTRQVTAARAKLWLLPAESGESSGPASRSDEGQMRVIVQVEDVVASSEVGGVFVTNDTRVVLTVPNTFRDNVKFLTWREISRIRATPERLNWVDPKRKALAFTLAAKTAAQQFAASVRAGGVIELVDDRGNPVTIRTGGLVWKGSKWQLTPATGGVIEVRYTKVTTRAEGEGEVAAELVASAAAASLSPEPTEEQIERRVSFRLDLERARVREQGRLGDAPERALIPLPRLSPKDDSARAYLAMGSRELLAAARPWLDRPVPDAEVQDKVYGPAGLDGALRRLDHDVLAKRNERMALAASCLVMVLCGAVTALKFAARMPLTVYLFSFFPALACMVTISGGQQVTVKQGAPGLLLMWSGVAALALYTLLVYLRLRRH
ncbi:hypothetical protein PHYC_03333 [Phycisphaerales bacterium]|nr:hypothetical protein PHYC_03333 [Phycisphaerales bacterium]